MTDRPKRPQKPPPSSSRKAPPKGRPVARSRVPGGINPRALDTLEREGLLTEKGRALRGHLAAGGARPQVRPAAASGARPQVRPAAASGARPQVRSAAASGARKLSAPAPRPRKGALRIAQPDETLAAPQRLHKAMAQAGVASRRHSEELIQAGRVTVNGQVITELGSKVIPGKDRIEVDGRPLGRPEQKVYILLNKPKGYMTTLYDPQNRPKVLDLLSEEVKGRVYPVGRLDFDTEGLLLLTNDGDVANALMHPSKKVKKTYIAKVRGIPSAAKIRQLETSIELDDGPTAPAEVKMIEVKPPNTATVSIRIHEGRNRQVRRMFEAIGHEVIHLKRTTIGPLHAGELPAGAWRELTAREVDDLRLSVGLPTEKKAPASTRSRTVSKVKAPASSRAVRPQVTLDKPRPAVTPRRSRGMVAPKNRTTQ